MQTKKVTTNRWLPFAAGTMCDTTPSVAGLPIQAIWTTKRQNSRLCGHFNAAEESTTWFGEVFTRQRTAVARSRCPRDWPVIWPIENRKKNPKIIIPLCNRIRLSSNLSRKGDIRRLSLAGESSFDSEIWTADSTITEAYLTSRATCVFNVWISRNEHKHEDEPFTKGTPKGTKRGFLLAKAGILKGLETRNLVWNNFSGPSRTLKALNFKRRHTQNKFTKLNLAKPNLPTDEWMSKKRCFTY